MIFKRKKNVDSDITTDQRSSGFVSKMTVLRILDLEILSTVVSSLCYSACNQAIYQKTSQGKKD